MTSGAVESKELSDSYFLIQMSTFSKITIKLFKSKGLSKWLDARSLQNHFFSKETIKNSKVKFKNITFRIIL